MFTLVTGNKCKHYFYVHCSLFPWKSQFLKKGNELQ
nr:MAG TPA: hypothetical protein [Caudoviricetes sp.]